MSSEGHSGRLRRQAEAVIVSDLGAAALQSASENRVPVIDAHAHVFRPASVSPRGVDDLVPADRDASLESYLDRLHSAGIDGAVLVPLDAHDDYVAESLASLGGAQPPAGARFFTGIAVASAVEQGRTAADPLDALLRRRERYPFAALRTMWLGEPGVSLRESPMLPVLRHLAAEGLPLWSYLPPDQAPHLQELGRLLPDLRVVLNHMGFAPHAMGVDQHRRPAFVNAFPEAAVTGVEALAEFPGFHLMFSGHYALSAEEHPFTDLHPAGARLVEAFGADRTLWGSDSPWIDDVPGYAAMAELVDVALPTFSPDERAQVRGGTVARLLGLPTTT